MPALGHAYWAGIMENSSVIMHAQYVWPVCVPGLYTEWSIPGKMPAYFL